MRGLGETLKAILLLAAVGSSAGTLGQVPAPSQTSPQPRPAPPLAPPLIPRAQIDNSLEVTGDPLQARVRQSRMTVGAFVNGQGPFRFLIDTGADRSVIGSGVARRLGLPVEGSARLHHVAGATLVGTVTLDSLRIGSNEVMGIRAPALPEQFLGAEGIMGIDALREQLIAMDFDRRTITIQHPRHATRSTVEGGEIVVTGRRRKGQLILTVLRIDNVLMDAVIDTGTQVTMGNGALYRRLFGGRRAPQMEPVDIASVTGQIVKAQYVVVPEIRIASLTIQNVPIAFVDAPPFKLFGIDDRPALLLGNDVLESFRRVTLDFRRRKVRFLRRS